MSISKSFGKQFCILLLKAEIAAHKFVGKKIRY